MFARELVSTFGGTRVGALKGSMSATFTALGATQAAAAAITTVFTKITTATEGQGVILPASMDVSDQATVCNATTVDVYLYPPVGGNLNGSSANVPLILAPNTSVDCTCVDGTSWIVNR